MKIAVVGTGYVGLVTGTCFAEAGNDVLCVDNNQEKLSMLRAGQVPIYEPGLETLFERNTKEGRLNFTDSLPDAVEFADIIFLALPTPPTEDGSADLKYVLGVASEIGTLLKDYRVVVNKSTVPVGTADKVRDAIAAQTDVEFDVVSNPEFL
ncbi:MAG: 2-dehydropantoate 2-reductase N-terminal domain-containing protein, partial [Bacteroidota bacterium]